MNNTHQALIEEKAAEFLDRNKLVFSYHDKKLREEGYDPADHSEAAGMVLEEILQATIDTVLERERERASEYMTPEDGAAYLEALTPTN